MNLKKIFLVFIFLFSWIASLSFGVNNTGFANAGKFDELIKEYCSVIMQQQYVAYKTADECFGALEISTAQTYAQCLENKNNDLRLGDEGKCNAIVENLYRGIIDSFGKQKDSPELDSSVSVETENQEEDLEAKAEVEANDAFCQPVESGSISVEVDNMSIPTANAAMFANYSVVQEVGGEVLIKQSGSNEWLPVSKGMRVSLEDLIRTGKDGNCTVKFANSAVFTMKPLSTLSLSAEDNTQNTSCNVGFSGMIKWILPKSAGNNWGAKTPLGTTIRDNFKGYLKSMVPHGGNIAFALTSGEIVIYASYDDSTMESKFYVEQGSADIFSNDKVAVSLNEGEQITVYKNQIVSEVTKGEELSDKWWSVFEEGSLFARFLSHICVAILVLILVVFATIFKRRKSY